MTKGKTKNKQPSIYTSRIPRDFSVICSTYSELTTRSNRAWLATGLLSMAAITAVLSGEAQLANATGVLRIFSGNMFFAYLTFLIALANFHFLVLISQCFQMQFIFMKYLHNLKADSINISESVSLKEIAHHMNRSGYNRFVPAIMELKKDNQERVSNLVKPISDLFYIGFPAAGLISAIFGMLSSVTEWDVPQRYFVGVSLFFAFLSLFCSALGFVTATQARKRWQKWIVKKKAEEEAAAELAKEEIAQP